jgi:hypothetical protein
MRKGLFPLFAFPALFASVALFTACYPTPAAPSPLAFPFNPAEVTWAQGQGTAIVEGQAFLKTRGGDVKYGAGNLVQLIPVTKQSSSWYSRRMVTDGLVTDMDPSLRALIRTTTSGGDGRFKFENLPAGPYFVVTTVTWETASGYAGAMETQGGYVGAQVQAERDKTANLILSR